MKDKEAKIRCGIFLIAGLLILLLLLFLLGGRDLFVRKATIRTAFLESVQGLSTGSAVKYRGAPVGSVSKITILVDRRMVQVDMEIELDSFGGTPDSFENYFRRELRQGLRCRMEFLGITGMKFIDLDYFAGKDDELPKAPDFEGDPTAIYVPSVPSSFRDIYASLVTAMERISKIKFEEIADGIDRTLNEFSGLLADPAIKSVIARVNDAAANLESTTAVIARSLDEKRIVHITELLENGLKGFDVLVNTMTEESRKAKISESAASFRAAADSISESRREISNTLQKFNQLMDSIRMLTDYLERDPNSLINGKKESSSPLTIR